MVDYDEHRTIENPMIGDRVTFVKTAAETDGEYELVRVVLQPGGALRFIITSRSPNNSKWRRDSCAWIATAGRTSCCRETRLLRPLDLHAERSAGGTESDFRHALPNGANIER